MKLKTIVRNLTEYQKSTTRRSACVPAPANFSTPGQFNRLFRLLVPPVLKPLLLITFALSRHPLKAINTEMPAKKHTITQYFITKKNGYDSLK